MIDDLEAVDVERTSETLVHAIECSCPCGCVCNCTQCNCYCSSDDYAYDQDNTYLHYPSDTDSVRGNPRTLGWEYLYIAVY